MDISTVQAQLNEFEDVAVQLIFDLDYTLKRPLDVEELESISSRLTLLTDMIKSGLLPSP